MVSELDHTEAVERDSVVRVLAPWRENPYQLVSWWDMQKFSADMFLAIGEYLTETRMQLEALSQQPENSREIVRQPSKDEKESGHHRTLTIVRDLCGEIGLTISVKAIKPLLDQLSQPSRLGDLIDSLKEVENTIFREMEDQLFMYIPPDRAPFYDKPELFGKNVNAKVPTIQFDIVEAGNCYASGRGTAAVFHLMRIMEVGVQQFGIKLGVSLVNEKNWQNILDEVNKAIKGLPTKDLRTVELSQLSANLYAVKLAWRNEVMHPRDTYTMEEADNLIQQVRLFMEQLVAIL